MGFVEALLAFPLLLLIRVYVLDEMAFWLWLCTIPPVYVFGCLFRIRWPNVRLLLGLLIPLAVAFALSWLMFRNHPLALAVSVPTIGLALYRGGMYAGRLPQQVLTPSHYMVSILLYFIFSIASRFAPDLSDFQQTIAWSGLLALIISLFMANRHVLQRESLQGEKRQAVAKSIVWKNRLLLFGFILLIAIIVVFDKIRSAVLWLAQQIVKFIVWLMSLGGGEEEAAEQPGLAQPDLQMEPPPEPARFWVILEQIVKWIVLIAIVIAVIWLLFYVAKRIAKAIRQLYAWLMDRLQLGDLAGADAGYEDEVERLADWKDMRKEWADRLKSWFAREHAKKWHQLPNNKERIRFLYRQAMIRLISRGYQAQASLTPRETRADARRWQGRDVMDAQLIELYEQVRYGEREPQDEEVAALKRKLDADDE